MRQFLEALTHLRSKARTLATSVAARWRAFIYALGPAVLLFSPITAHAGLGDVFKSLVGGGGGALESLIVWVVVIYAMSNLISKLLINIFIWLINFLIGVSQYNSFLGSPFVTIGWAVTRDMANLFLVIALLVIAFATILNIQSYQAQTLLKEFLIAALAVNFSKMICGLMIDLSQVVMMTFVSGYSETGAQNFVDLFKIQDWLKLAVQGGQDKLADQNFVAKLATNLFTTIAGDIFNAVIAFFGVVAVLGLVLVLVGRILTLWMLIIAAPLAFVGKVLPMTKSYSSKWWEAMFKQLLSGPIVAFIVWISLASISISGKAFDITGGKAAEAGTLYAEANSVSVTQISNWSTLALYFVPIVLFVMGAKWAVSMSGGIGASAANWARGKAYGYGKKGLSMLQKQAIYGGKGSIGNQALRGFKGQSTMFSSTAGAVGRGADWANQKTSNGLERTGTFLAGAGFGAIGGKLIAKAQKDRATGSTTNRAIQNTVGEQGRSDVRRFGGRIHKKATEWGLTKESEEKEKKSNAAHDASANAGQLRTDARKQYNLEMAEAGGDINAQSAAEAKFKSAKSRASQMVKKHEEYYKEKNMAEGKTSAEALIADTASNAGHLDEGQVHTNSIMAGEDLDRRKGLLDKKKEQHIDKKRAEAKEQNLEVTDKMESDWRRSAEGEVAKDKKDLEDKRDQMESLVNNYRGESTTEIDARISERAKGVASGEVNRSGRDAAGTHRKEAHGDVGAPRSQADEDRANEKLAQALQSAVTKGFKEGVSAQQLGSMVSNSTRGVAVEKRADFYRNLSQKLARDTTNGAALASVVSSVEARLGAISGRKATEEIEQRFANDSSPEKGLRFKEQHLGFNRDADGKQTLSGEATVKLEKALENDISMLARFTSSVLSHAETQRIVGQKVTTPAQVITIQAELSSKVVDPAERSIMARSIADAILKNSRDPSMIAAANTLRALP